MQQWLVFILLAVLVVVLAYALGTYVARRQGSAPPPPPPPSNKRPALRGTTDRRLKVVVTWLLSQAFEQTGVRVADDKIAYQRIVEAAEKALHDLRNQEVVIVSLPYLTADASGPKHLEARITREMIEELVKY